MRPANFRAQLRTGGSLSSMGVPTMIQYGNFRSFHIPIGMVELNQDEFQALKQGSMTVSEYRDKFAQLSCYALDAVSDDAKK